MTAAATDARLNFLSMSRIARRDFGDNSSLQGATFVDVAQWLRDYLMSAHPDLGRPGDVCPFTAQAARADVLRVAVSQTGPDDLPGIRRQILQAFATFDEIAYPKGMADFRAVIVAFPNCGEGVTSLVAVQKSLRRLAFAKARMVGLFHRDARAPGLRNPAFRPLKAPIPIFAIRALVENDAAFVMRHPLLAPAYLRRFPLAGGKRLMLALWKRA